MNKKIFFTDLAIAILILIITFGVVVFIPELPLVGSISFFLHMRYLAADFTGEGWLGVIAWYIIMIALILIVLSGFRLLLKS